MDWGCFGVALKIGRMGLIGLLIAVYPANIHMLINEVYLPGMKEKMMLGLGCPFNLACIRRTVLANQPKSTPPTPAPTDD